MGQQQLLLLVLGAIIVSVAIIVGINMFNQNVLTSSVDATKQDCLNIAARAQEWVRKPSILGGPETRNTFTDIDWYYIGYAQALGAASYDNENATFTLTPAANQLTIEGVTKEADKDNQARKITCIVTTFQLDTLYVTTEAAP
jgi:hypothetical protein